MRLMQRIFALGKGLLLAVFFGASLLAFTTPSVHASTATIAPAKSQQLSVQQQIDAQLKRQPGGIQTAWNELTYYHGKIFIKYAPDTGTLRSPANYGICSTGVVCVYNGTNYGFPVAGIDPTVCHMYLITLGFIGAGSYAGTDGPLVETVHVYDEWNNLDFNILPGSIHHSPNTSANPDAVNAEYMTTC